MKKEVNSQHAPAALGPYSQAIDTGEFVFLSGQIPLYPNTGKIEYDVTPATHLVMNNIKAVLNASGLTFANIVKTTVFLRSMDDFAEMNTVYETYFKKPFPARSTVAVAMLPKNVPVEIECVAKR